MKILKQLLLLLLIAAADIVLIAIMLFVFFFIEFTIGCQQRTNNSRQVAEYADTLIAELSAREK